MGALSVAFVVSAVLALFLDYSFLYIFKVTWGALTMFIAVGFFLGKSGGRGNEKPQWAIDQERQELERQALTIHERNIKI